MRLIFSCLALLGAAFGSTAVAEQIGPKDPLLSRVTPVVFCVDPYPELDPDNPDTAIWTFPNSQVSVLPDSGRVPASLGTAFGLEVQAAGPDRLRDVTVTIDHPRLPDGATQHTWVASYPSERFGYSFFGFGFPEELAAGVWTFTVTKDARTLYRYAFTVDEPNRATQAFRFCE